MTEDRMDSIRLDYIAERSDHGRAAVEALRSSRAEYLQKAYGKKDKDKAQAEALSQTAGSAAMPVHAR
jgi:COX assembly protein 1